MPTTVPNRYIAYYRVSTDRQGKSGLGLDAQQSAVDEYCSTTGGEVVASFTEVESGRRTDRPELEKAMAACKMHRANLLVAKLDRLARNAHFLLGLKEAGIEFVCCDMPSANRLTVGIMAMVAEEEARMISTRTKAALAAAKARGVKLGSPGNLTGAGRRRGAQRASKARTEGAQRFAELLAPTISQISHDGVFSLQGIAKVLNERGIPARRGGLWSATQVSRLLSATSLNE